MIIHGGESTPLQTRAPQQLTVVIDGQDLSLPAATAAPVAEHSTTQQQPQA